MFKILFFVVLFDFVFTASLVQTVSKNSDIKNEIHSKNNLNLDKKKINENDKILLNSIRESRELSNKNWLLYLDTSNGIPSPLIFENAESKLSRSDNLEDKNDNLKSISSLKNPTDLVSTSKLDNNNQEENEEKKSNLNELFYHSHTGNHKNYHHKKDEKQIIIPIKIHTKNTLGLPTSILPGYTLDHVYNNLLNYQLPFGQDNHFTSLNLFDQNYLFNLLNQKNYFTFSNLNSYKLLPVNLLRNNFLHPQNSLILPTISTSLPYYNLMTNNYVLPQLNNFPTSLQSNLNYLNHFNYPNSYLPYNENSLSPSNIYILNSLPSNYILKDFTNHTASNKNSNSSSKTNSSLKESSLTKFQKDKLDTSKTLTNLLKNARNDNYFSPLNKLTKLYNSNDFNIYTSLENHNLPGFEFISNPIKYSNFIHNHDYYPDRFTSHNYLSNLKTNLNLPAQLYRSTPQFYSIDSESSLLDEQKNVLTDTNNDSIVKT